MSDSNNTSVQWQMNPYGGTIPTWSYGNWGGKGWSAGEFTPPSKRPNWEIRGKDDLDEIFKAHDKAYADTQDAWDASAKTPADIANYWNAIISADKQMRAGIQNLKLNNGWDDTLQNNTVPNFNMANAAIQADRAFALKGMYNVLALQVEIYWGAKNTNVSFEAMNSDANAFFAERPTTRLNDTWIATDLGNGSRLLKVSPSDPNTVVVLSSGVYQKLEIPDGKGGYLQVAIGDKTTDVTSWAGLPGQSEQLKRVLTTQTETGQNVKSYQGTVLATESAITSQVVNGQSVQVTETVNHLAKGTEIASSKELVTSGGAKIVNSTTADGHIQEDTYATVDGKQTLQSSKIISYSKAERDKAANDVYWSRAA